MTQADLNFDRQGQNRMILEALKSGQKLTPLDCLNLYGCLRTSGRIYDLKHGVYDGTKYPIEKDMVEVGNGKRVAQYRMEAQ